MHSHQIIPATMIALEKREGLPQPQPPLRLSVPDAWEQANAQMQRWSTFTNRLQKIRFTVTYADGRHYVGQLELPWFDRLGSLPEAKASLGAHMRCHLERYPQWPYWTPGQCEEALQEALAFLSTYEIGGPDEREATRDVTLRVSMLDFSAWPLHPLPSPATRGRNVGDQHTNEPGF
jgi:hypothetical protein